MQTSPAMQASMQRRQGSTRRHGTNEPPLDRAARVCRGCCSRWRQEKRSSLAISVFLVVALQAPPPSLNASAAVGAPASCPAQLISRMCAGDTNPYHGGFETMSSRPGPGAPLVTVDGPVEDMAAANGSRVDPPMQAHMSAEASAASAYSAVGDGQGVGAHCSEGPSWGWAHAQMGAHAQARALMHNRLQQALVHKIKQSEYELAMFEQQERAFRASAVPPGLNEYFGMRPDLHMAPPHQALFGPQRWPHASPMMSEARDILLQGSAHQDAMQRRGSLRAQLLQENMLPDSLPPSQGTQAALRVMLQHELEEAGSGQEEQRFSAGAQTPDAREVEMRSYGSGKEAWAALYAQSSPEDEIAGCDAYNSAESWRSHTEDTTRPRVDCNGHWTSLVDSSFRGVEADALAGRRRGPEVRSREGLDGYQSWHDVDKVSGEHSLMSRGSDVMGAVFEEASFSRGGRASHSRAGLTSGGGYSSSGSGRASASSGSCYDSSNRVGRRRGPYKKTRDPFATSLNRVSRLGVDTHCEERADNDIRWFRSATREEGGRDAHKAGGRHQDEQGYDWIRALKDAADEHDRSMGPVTPLIGPDAVVELRPPTAGADAGHGRRGADEDEGWSALLESVTSRASSPSGDPVRNSLATQGRQGQVSRRRGRPWLPKARREGGVPKSDGTKPDIVDARGSEELGRRESGAPDVRGTSLPGRGDVDVEAPASSAGASLVGSSRLVEPVSASTGQGPKCAALKSSKKGRKCGVKPMDGEIIINRSGLEVSESLQGFPTMKAWLIANGHEELANTPRPDMTHTLKNEYHRLYQHYQGQRRKHLADCSTNVRPSSEREGESDLVPGVPRLLDWLKALGHADLAMTRQKDRTPAQKRLYSNLYYRYVALKKPKQDLMQEEASLRGIHQRRRKLEDYVLARVSADVPRENPVERALHSSMPALALTPPLKPVAASEGTAPAVVQRGDRNGRKEEDGEGNGGGKPCESAHDSTPSGEHVIISEVSCSSSVGGGKRSCKEAAAGSKKSMRARKPVARDGGLAGRAGGSDGSGGKVIGSGRGKVGIGRKQGSSKVRVAARGSLLSETGAGDRGVVGATSACKGPMSNDEEDACRKKRRGRKGNTGPKNGLSTPTAEAGCEMVDE